MQRFNVAMISLTVDGGVGSGRTSLTPPERYLKYIQ